MSFFALILILLSAVMHATWNYFLKRVGGGITFIWLFTLMGSIIYAPFALGLIIYSKPHIGWMEILFIVGTAAIHLLYSFLLQKGYKIGDFSLVYPIARGTGPMLAALAAIFIYQEKLTFIELLGVFLIVGSIFFLTGGLKALKQSSSLPMMYGLAVGVTIAGYTLLDKGAVSIVLIAPLLLNYFSNLGQLIVLTPVAVRGWDQVRFDWAYHKKEAIGIGILSSLAYILVLTTMVFTPVSHVAPVREVSILIGTLMGTRLLAEGFGLRRMMAAGAMVIGIIAVALS